MENKIFAETTYIILLTLILTILLLHIFNIIKLNTDKFSVFLITLLFTLLIFPAVTNIKAFGIIDLKRDEKALSSNNKDNVKNDR